MFQTSKPRPVNIQSKDRRGRVRGMAALRLVERVGDMASQSRDPLEYRALATLERRAARLAARAQGLRGWAVR